MTPADARQWWRDAVGCEVDLRSSSDGVGDLVGTVPASATLWLAG